MSQTVYLIGKCPLGDPDVKKQRLEDARLFRETRSRSVDPGQHAARRAAPLATSAADSRSHEPHRQKGPDAGAGSPPPDSVDPYYRIIRVDRTLQRPERLSKILEEDGSLVSHSRAQALMRDMERRYGVAGHGEEERKEGAADGGAGAKSGGSSARSSTAMAGGLFKANAVCILGCIKLLQSYTIVFVEESVTVGTIGSHELHSVSKVSMLPLTVEPAKPMLQRMSEWFQPDPGVVAEDRYRLLFEAVQLENESYFSPTYDLTRTLQEQTVQTFRRHGNRQHVVVCSAPSGTEMPRASGSQGAAAPAHEASERATSAPTTAPPLRRRPRAEHMWNSYLAEEMSQIVHSSWITPVVYGYLDQRVFRVMGKLARLTLLGRRLTEFAGTRYLKRGISSFGFVANDVEVEQILEDGTGQMASFVQVRGSVPVSWSQKTSFATAKPKIELDSGPSDIVATRRHFAHLMERYGTPVCVLNLLKKKESSPREVRIGSKFATVVRELNASLPAAFRVQFAALDFDRLQKSEGGNVVDALHDAARWSLVNTGCFVAKQGKMPVRLPRGGAEQPSDGDAGGNSASAAASASTSTEVGEASSRLERWGEAVSRAASREGPIPGLSPLNCLHGSRRQQRKSQPPSGSQLAMALGFPPDAAPHQTDPTTVSSEPRVMRQEQRELNPLAHNWR